MRYLATIFAIVIGVLPGLASAGDLLGVLNQVGQGLGAVNAVLGGKPAGSTTGPGNVGHQTGPATMASPDAATGGQQETKLVVPADTRTRAAIEAALPTIKQVVGIHRCVRAFGGMLQLNNLAVPGVNMGSSYFPDHEYFMNYHDRSKCVSARAIDNWAMPALNALQFRVVYFAEDSGETVNFVYLLKKTEDGSWKLQSTERRS